MSRIELLAPFEEPIDAGATPFNWPTLTGTTQIQTGLDWDLTQYGHVASAAIDLLHIAAAAYLADLGVGRPLTFSRTIELIVHVHNPSIWAGPAGQAVTDLLAWISGDQWTLTTVPIDPALPARGVAALTAPVENPTDTMLLSGGLDSFCGAVDHLKTTQRRLHIGHLDAATSVKHAQHSISAWLTEQNQAFSWLRHELRPTAKKKENTTRTRSFLFMAMAIAAASGSGAPEVIVPENGFTSMNVPLIPSRGGARSTKSTHPWTFHLINTVLEHAAVDVKVINPYIGVTKGHLLKQAISTGPAGFLDKTASTLSCAKLDSGRVKKKDGGNPNINCGLCFACLVRRGAYNGAGVSDPTDYLVNRLTKPALKTFRQRRHDDLWALKLAEKRPFTEDDLIASASWPPGWDLDAIFQLVKAGREELFSVPR